MDSSKIGERLKVARKEKGLTLKNVYEKTGISTGNLSEIENGIKSPSSQTLFLLKKLYEVSIDWVLSGEIYKHQAAGGEFLGLPSFIREAAKSGEKCLQDLELCYNFIQYMRTNNRLTDSKLKITKLDNSQLMQQFGRVNRTTYVPVLGNAAAGEPIEIIEMKEEEVPVDEKHARYNAFIVRAKGDSMTGDGINDGDLVVIRPQPIVENGEMALVNVAGEAAIKRIYKASPEDYELRSSNDKYAPINVHGKDLKVIGKVVETINESAKKA